MMSHDPSRGSLDALPPTIVTVVENVHGAAPRSYDLVAEAKGRIADMKELSDRGNGGGYFDFLKQATEVLTQACRATIDERGAVRLAEIVQARANKLNDNMTITHSIGECHHVYRAMDECKLAMGSVMKGGSPGVSRLFILYACMELKKEFDSLLGRAS
jgi:hypothetical protein